MMPPASLPALAAMMPGPANAATATNRRRELRATDVRRTCSTAASAASSAFTERAPISLQQPREVEPSAPWRQRVDDIVSQDAPEDLIAVDDEYRRPPAGNELLGHLSELRRRAHHDRWLFGGEIGHGRGVLGDHDVEQADVVDQTPQLVDQDDGVEVAAVF